MDLEKHGMVMGFKNMSGIRELYFKKTMRNVICCLKVCLLIDTIFFLGWKFFL